ncbi:MAG TPA: hypothetical protein VIP75_11920 [Acidothermales bacterium]|jgi:hypothetical protein
MTRVRLVAALMRDRGDVPGWVMITVMTAGIVVLLTAVAGPQLQEMFQNALDSVTG